MSNWTIVGGTGTGIAAGTGGTTPTPAAALSNKATFFAGFGNPILPGTDFGPRVIVSKPSTPSSLLAFLKNPPAAGSFTFDILLSVDGGITWNSILNNPISMTASGPITSSDFAPTSGFAVGNLLRLDVYSTGVGPGFSNGFQCVLVMSTITPPTFDRATFNFGMLSAPPVGKDFGGYYIVANPTVPEVCYLVVKNPPPAAVTLDLQVQRKGLGAWSSIFPSGGQAVVPAGLVGTMETGDFVSNIGFSPGDLIRPFIVSGPPATGMSYSFVLELEVVTS
jgi:hypothetical protein